MNIEMASMYSNISSKKSIKLDGHSELYQAKIENYYRSSKTIAFYHVILIVN